MSLFGSPKSALLMASAAVLGISGAGIVAQQASAQLTTQFEDCTPGVTAPACLNGQGASFAFELFTGNEDFDGVIDEFFSGLFNYSSQGSSSGRRSYVSNFSEDAVVLPPYVFSFSEAPLTDDQVASYSAAVPPGNTTFGYGVPVQFPLVGGFVTVAYNSATGLPNGVDLTREEYCSLFNDAPGQRVASLPAALQNATGVRRSDGSGTTFITATALDAQCGPLGLWEYTTANGTFSRGVGADSLPDNDPACLNGAPDDTVCWPEEIIGRDTNQRIANELTDTPLPGDPASVPGPEFAYLSGSANAAAGLFAADLENPTAGRFVSPNPAEASLASNFGTLLEGSPNDPDAIVPGSVGNSCRLTLIIDDPDDGYPIVGFSYLMAYNDYFPDRISLNGAPSPRAGAFANQGDFYRDQINALITGLGVTNAAARQRMEDLDYVPVGTGLGQNLAARALTTQSPGTGTARPFPCIGSVVN